MPEPVIQWRRRARWRVAGVLGVVVLISALDHARGPGRRAARQQEYHGRVARVIYAADGDTLDLDLPDGGRPMTRVRLWGVDCPEIAHAPGEIDAHFGREAADFVRREVVGRRVRVELDRNRSNRDRYGRLLAYLAVLAEGSEGEGELLNRMLIDRGLAYADRRFDHVRMQEFVAAEQRAEKSRVGLWAKVQREQMPPWRQNLARDRGESTARHSELRP